MPAVVPVWMTVSGAPSNVASRLPAATSNLISRVPLGKAMVIVSGAGKDGAEDARAGAEGGLGELEAELELLSVARNNVGRTNSGRRQLGTEGDGEDGEAAGANGEQRGRVSFGGDEDIYGDGARSAGRESEWCRGCIDESEAGGGEGDLRQGDGRCVGIANGEGKGEVLVGGEVDLEAGRGEFGGLGTVGYEEGWPQDGGGAEESGERIDGEAGAV